MSRTKKSKVQISQQEDKKDEKIVEQTETAPAAEETQTSQEESSSVTEETSSPEEEIPAEDETSAAEETPVMEESTSTEDSSSAKTKKDKSLKKKSGKKNIRLNFSTQVEHFRNGGKPLLWTIIFTFLIMIIACLAVFFTSVQGAEQVMVPNVLGKDLETALLEMQAKELYPRIQLKYSDIPGDEGTILEQNPDAGAIVKAYRRINLTVSRGLIVDEVADYTGLKFDEVKMQLQTQFTGQKQLIILAEPVYKADLSEAGTILEQNPPAGTQIVDPVTVQLIVSRGNTFENTKRPVIAGRDLNTLLRIMSSSKIVYEFTSHIALEGEKAGTVITEDKFTDEYVPNYSRIKADIAFPEEQKDIKYGLFTANLPDYPFDIAVRLDATDTDGNTTNYLSIRHTGKLLTIPYAVQPGTVLTLFVADEEYAQLKVE